MPAEAATPRAARRRPSVAGPARLGFLGLAEDPEANARHGRGTGGRISRAGPAVALVVPTDEEWLIGRDTARLIAAGDGRGPLQ